MKHSILRRQFMRIAGAAGLAVQPRAQCRQTLASKREPASGLVRTLFDSGDPKIIQLVDDVFRHCILGKIHPPEPPLKHNWIAPGGGYYGQWLWDTMFVVDLLSLLPGKQQVIRDVFQNYWDFQVRWNAVKPDFMHDMIPCAIRPGKDWVNLDHQFSQIPILAWGIERVHARNGDMELVRQSLKPLERFHEWYWRERDVTNIGLVAVGAYVDERLAAKYRPGTPPEQHARWETYDHACDMDDLNLTRHPTRKSSNEGKWYGDTLVVGNSSYLILAERSLARLAELTGNNAMASRRKARIEKAVAAMREHMWDEESGLFLSVKRDTLRNVPIRTCGSWMPLAAGVPKKAMARRMAEVYQTPNWQTPLPIPTVDRTDRRWGADRFWRGDVWPAVNYQLAGGLADYGYHELAADLSDKTVANAIANGISEHYDCVTGKPLGVKHLGMTCTVVAMMLDGLCRNHQLRLRSEASGARALG